MTSNFQPCLRMVVDTPKVIAVRHRRECAVERKDLEAMARQIEFADDFGPQQGNYVGTNREFESGKNFFSDCRPAEHMATLQHEHALSRAREIGCVDQSVVAAADDDTVVFGVHDYQSNFVGYWSFAEVVGRPINYRQMRMPPQTDLLPILKLA